MDDTSILRMFENRNENAISEVSRKYLRYCTKIAFNILCNNEDVAECVNDVWFKAWNSIPPNNPSNLATYLGKLTRNTSFNMYKSLRATKRGGGEIEVVLDELLVACNT